MRLWGHSVVWGPTGRKCPSSVQSEARDTTHQWAAQVSFAQTWWVSTSEKQVMGDADRWGLPCVLTQPPAFPVLSAMQARWVRGPRPGQSSPAKPVAEQ